MITKNYRLGVDAGNISAIDEGLIKKYGGAVDDRKLVKLIKLPKGRYDVFVRVKDTWNDKNGKGVTNSDVVEVTGQGIVIGDACYSFPHEAWTKFLDDTKMLAQFPEGGGFEVGTGGDGSFKVEVEIKPVAAPTSFEHPKTDLERNVKIAVLEKEIELWTEWRKKAIADAQKANDRASELHDEITAKRSQIVALLKEGVSK